MYSDSSLAREMCLIGAGKDSTEVQYQIKASFFIRRLTFKKQYAFFNELKCWSLGK